MLFPRSRVTDATVVCAAQLGCDGWGGGGDGQSEQSGPPSVELRLTHCAFSISTVATHSAACGECCEQCLALRSSEWGDPTRAQIHHASSTHAAPLQYTGLEALAGISLSPVDTFSSLSSLPASITPVLITPHLTTLHLDHSPLQPLPSSITLYPTTTFNRPPSRLSLTTMSSRPHRLSRSLGPLDEHATSPGFPPVRAITGRGTTRGRGAGRVASGGDSAAPTSPAARSTVPPSTRSSSTAAAKLQATPRPMVSRATSPITCSASLFSPDVDLRSAARKTSLVSRATSPIIAEASVPASAPPSAPPAAASTATDHEEAPMTSAASLSQPLPTVNTISGLTQDAVVARNGRGVCSPIELMVFDLPHHHKTAASEALRRALRKIELPNLDTSMLEVSPEAAGGEDGGRPSCVRLSWSLNARHEARMRPIDLLAEMESARTQLNKRFCARWASAPGVDRRCHGQFQLVVQKEGVRIAADDAVVWAQSLVQKLGFRLIDIIPAGFDHSLAVGETRGLDVIMNTPAAVEKVAEAIRRQAPTFGGHVVTFFPSDSVVTLSSPATIIGPDMGTVQAHYLENELQIWVNQFNESNNTNDFLHVVSGTNQTVGRVLGCHAYAVPSSVGLAEFIAAQTPCAGDHWELAFDLNESKLVPQRVLDDMQMAQAASLADGMRELRTEFNALTVSLRGIHASVDSGVSEMGRQTINLQTFGRDLYNNLRTLFGELDDQGCIDRDVLVLTIKLKLIEGQLAEVNREIILVEAEMNEEGGNVRRDLLIKAKSQLEADKRDTTKQRAQHAVQRNTKVALVDRTGLTVTAPPSTARLGSSKNGQPMKKAGKGSRM